MALGKQDPVHNSEKGYTSVPRLVMLFRMASCSYHIVCRLSCKYNTCILSLTNSQAMGSTGPLYSWSIN